MDNILSDNTFSLDEFNPKSIAEKIAKNLKQRRLELNLTQKKLANKSGVSYGSVKRFESKNQISLINLLMLAVVLNATEEFQKLFSKMQYQSIDDVLKLSKTTERKRARK